MAYESRTRQPRVSSESGTIESILVSGWFNIADPDSDTLRADRWRSHSRITLKEKKYINRSLQIEPELPQINEYQLTEALISNIGFLVVCATFPSLSKTSNTYGVSLQLCERMFGNVAVSMNLDASVSPQ
ncbi:hypothetical protein V3C99_011070 [Haemonchus contortus]